MRTTNNILLVLLTSLLIGCSQNYMELKPALDKDPYVMYGKTPQRNFFNDMPLSDSLKFLWTTEANGSFNYSSVSYYDKYLFAADLSGRVFCFNIENGKKVGQLKVKNGAIYSAPYVDINQLIYVSALFDDNRSRLVYYNMNKNDLIKEITLTGRVVNEMLINGDDIILSTETGRIYCYNKKAEKKWEVKTDEFIHSSPVLGKEHFYFGTDRGDIIAMVAATGDSVYRKHFGGSFQGGGSISGDKMYIGNDNGSLYCIDYNSGNLIWEYKSGSRITMTPAYDNDYIYAGNLDGYFFALEKSTGKVFWNKRMGTLFNIAPLVTSNYLLIPDQFKKVYFADKKTGDIKKSMDFDSRVRLTPVIVNKKIVIIGYDIGVLNAYEIL